MCGRDLTILEVLPVFSWLVLRGRARCCGAKLPWRWPIEEFSVGCAFFISVMFNPYLGVALALGALGVVGLVEIARQSRQLAGSGPVILDEHSSPQLLEK